MLLWSRPAGAAAPFCVVHRIDASVHTLCDGRWYAEVDREETSQPADRCGRCERVLAMVAAAHRMICDACALDDFVPFDPPDYVEVTFGIDRGEVER